MKVVELFSGNADITKKFKNRLIDCVSIDYDSTKNPDLVKNVYELSDEYLSQFDFIWASPDCTTYSLAGHGLHRKKGCIPITDYAKECDINNEKLINQLINLNIPFVIENPRGQFRHLECVKKLYRITVYYSSYGFPYTKPTDLFSNVPLILDRFNQTISRGHIHLDYVHQYKDFLGRCKMPEELINDIIDFAEEVTERNRQVEGFVRK